MSFPEASTYLVCGRKGDPHCTHTSEFTPMNCEACDADVMASPATYQRFMKHGEPIICLECLAEFRKNQETKEVRLEPPLPSSLPTSERSDDDANAPEASQQDPP